MNNMQMAHEYALEMLKETLPTGSLYGDDANRVAMSMVELAWMLADAMQAKADEREDRTRPAVLNMADSPQLDWQPDWSQAPDEAKYWAMDKDGSANFFKNKPEITNGNGWDFGGVMQSQNSHAYTGNWKNSLRKRPQ